MTFIEGSRLLLDMAAVDKTESNKTLGRALDPHANGAWLSTNSMKHEVFILGRQRIDQKSKKGW